MLSEAISASLTFTPLAIERSVVNAEPDQSQLHEGPLQTPVTFIGAAVWFDRPPATGPAGMLVHRWPRSQRRRLRWLGLRNRPRGEDRNEDFWRRRLVDQRCMRAFGVVEKGLRTPTGSLAGKFYIGFIRGSGARFSSTPPLIKRTAVYSNARLTARMPELAPQI